MPRFGALQATDVWAAAARTLTDISAEEIFDLPALTTTYPNAEPLSAAEANAFGSWVQISANIGTGKRLILATVTPAQAASPAWELEIGEGASGSEVAVTKVSGVNINLSAAGQASPLVFPLWKSLTDGARISCRVKDDSPSALAYEVVLMVA